MGARPKRPPTRLCPRQRGRYIKQIARMSEAKSGEYHASVRMRLRRVSGAANLLVVLRTEPGYRFAHPGYVLLPLFHMAWARRLHRHSQAPDFLPPSHRKAVAVGVAAVIPHAAHAECQLVLRVHECRRCAAPHAVDTARTKDTVANDLLILARSSPRARLPRPAPHG